MKVHTLKQCRPDQEETEYFWKLFHAAQRNDARWHGSEISIIADELSRTDLDRNQKLFLLRSWQVLVDDKGGFGRFMGAFDTYVYNIQDPDDDCVAWKPELAQILNDGNCFDVLLDAYQEAQQRIAELERSETQLINERDAAESALADMYQAATGERPEWSNMFGFADAVDVVEERLATLEANQSQTTPTGIQLITEAIGAHGYIVGCLLQGRPDLALEESRKWVSAFGQAAEIVSAQDAAGIGVKGE
ncbi:TPA: hypothetical protein ACF99K_003094 [Salmonella enterica subsp. enterica serovar Newport]